MLKGRNSPDRTNTFQQLACKSVGNSFHSHAIMNGQRQVNCVGPYLSWDRVLFRRCLWRFGERAVGTLTSRPFFLSFYSFLTPGTLAVQAPSSKFDLPPLPTRTLSIATPYHPSHPRHLPLISFSWWALLLKVVCAVSLQKEWLPSSVLLLLKLGSVPAVPRVLQSRACENALWPPDPCSVTGKWTSSPAMWRAW